MNVEKWWNEICGSGKRKKPRENPTHTRFVHHETHMEWPRRELRTHFYLFELNQIVYLSKVTWWQAIQLASSLVFTITLFRVSVTPWGFRGGWNRVRVGFSRGFSCFPLPQISFHHFSTLISSISLHFIRPCDGVTGMVGWHPCYSLTYNIGASSHLIPRPDLVLDTSWGYFYFMSISLLNW